MKRFLRTKDNMIIDTEKFNHQKRKSFNYKVETCFVEITAESDNVFDLIRANDVIRYWGTLYEMYVCKSMCLCFFIKNDKETIITNKFWDIDNITQIYTKQGDNYILVWDKKRGIL